MTADKPSPVDKDRVVSLWPRRGQPPPRATTPVEDLAKYERSDEGDDYRHRMITNVLALAFLVLLVIGGIWIADTMAAMRKNQDCVLSGRRGCTPVEAPLPQRW